MGMLEPPNKESIMPVISSYTHFGGAHPETASLANVLTAQGLRAPHNGQPYSEALLFGIAGGLGAGYIMYEFYDHGTKVLVLGFHNNWQYTMRYYQNLADRLNITIAMLETGSRKAANALLTDALAAQQPVVAWVDRAFMPYLQLPEALKAHFGHLVAVCGSDGDDILVDDRAAAPFCVPAATFADARHRIVSYKNRMVRVKSTGEADLHAAIWAGIRACVEHLNSDSDSFSLPSLRKWGRMMTDSKNKKGWRVLFKNPRGLVFALRSIYEGIALDVGGGGLRGLYAAFLEEAAAITGNDTLNSVAAHYHALSRQWLDLAAAALPNGVTPLAETRTLLDERHALLMRGGEAWHETTGITHQLDAMSANYHRNFPLDNDGMRVLFEDLQAHIMAIYEGEKAAIEALGKVVG
jgi:hypothetical protein